MDDTADNILSKNLYPLVVRYKAVTRLHMLYEVLMLSPPMMADFFFTITNICELVHLHIKLYSRQKYDKIKKIKRIEGEKERHSCKFG